MHPVAVFAGGRASWRCVLSQPALCSGVTFHSTALQGTPGSLLLYPLKTNHHAQLGIQGLSQSGLALPFPTHLLLYPHLPVY